jgi:hypothetical protein
MIGGGRSSDSESVNSGTLLPELFFNAPAMMANGFLRCASALRKYVKFAEIKCKSSRIIPDLGHDDSNIAIYSVGARAE